MNAADLNATADATAEAVIRKLRLTPEVRDLDSLARGVLTCLKYPRGSEAQIRCLKEVGQDAEFFMRRIEMIYEHRSTPEADSASGVCQSGNEGDDSNP